MGWGVTAERKADSPPLLYGSSLSTTGALSLFSTYVAGQWWTNCTVASIPFDALESVSQHTCVCVLCKPVLG